jgi:DnaJ like chaperone protein
MSSQEKLKHPITFLKAMFGRVRTGPSPFSAESSMDKIDYTEEKPKSKRDLLQEKKDIRIKADEAKIKETTLIFSKIALGAKLAGVDGEINKHEVKSFKSVFPETNHPQIELGKFFGNAANDDISFEHYAKRVTTYFPKEQKLYKDLLLSLFEFGAIDGPLNVEEINFLHKVNGIFDLGDEFFYQTLRNIFIPTSKNPFKILGVKEKATIQEIKTAYRQAVQTYHPDRLSRIDCAKDILEIANERFAILTKAYNKIKSIKKS